MHIEIAIPTFKVLIRITETLVLQMYICKGLVRTSISINLAILYMYMENAQVHAEARNFFSIMKSKKMYVNEEL